MRFAAVAAICISFASGSYLAFNLSHPRRYVFPDVARAPEISPRSLPSAVTAETQPLQTPIQQGPETVAVAESTPEPAAAPAAAPSEPPLIPVEISSTAADESPQGFRVGLTPVWTPLIAGVLPGLAGNSVPAAPSEPRVTSNDEPITQPRSDQDAPDLSELNKSITAAEHALRPAPAASPSEFTGHASSEVAQGIPSTSDSTRESPSVAMLQPKDLPVPELSAEKSPTPSASTESSTDRAGTEQIRREEAVAPSPTKPDEPSAKIANAPPIPRPSQGIQQHPSPAGNISLTQSRENARKTREPVLPRSSARLYSSTTNTVLKPQPAEQKSEPEVSAPPPPPPAPDVASKSVNREPSGKTDVTGDLRRFAASYVRGQEKGDVANQEGYYAGSVHFYKEGDLSWTRIAAATRRFSQTSGPKHYSIAPANVHGPVDGGVWVVEQPYTWSKSNGAHVQTGRSVLRMRVIPSGRGGYKITSVEEVGS
jgi:hypothetical protein